jgi:hypothetical protein
MSTNSYIKSILLPTVVKLVIFFETKKKQTFMSLFFYIVQMAGTFNVSYEEISK